MLGRRYGSDRLLLVDWSSHNGLSLRVTVCRRCCFLLQAQLGPPPVQPPVTDEETALVVAITAVQAAAMREPASTPLSAAGAATIAAAASSPACLSSPVLSEALEQVVSTLCARGDAGTRDALWDAALPMHVFGLLRGIWASYAGTPVSRARL